MSIGPRLRRLTGVHEEETVVVRLVATVFALLEAGRALGEVGANALLVHRMPGALPGLFIPLGLLSLVVAVSYGAALSRIRRPLLLGTTLAAMGSLLVIEWAALAAGVDVVAVVWLTVMASGSIAVTIGWTVAGSTLDLRQAKRLFPLCTAAAIAGYLVGSLGAGPMARLVGTESLIPAAAVMLAAAGIVIARIARLSTGSGWRVPPAHGGSIVADVSVGFDEVRRSPLLRLVALAYVLFAVLLFSVSYPFLIAAGDAFPDEADLTAALGLVSAVVTGGSLLVALLVAKRFYARFGVAVAALILPLVYLGGFAVWVVSFSFATAAAVTIVQQTTQRGLSNAAWNAFYNVVPASRRAQVLAFTDGVPGQVGIILSGVLLLTVSERLAPSEVAWLGFATAAICTAVVVAIRARYGDALVRTLRSGVGEQLLDGGPAVERMLEVPEVHAALTVALTDPAAPVRELAASLLSRSDTPQARAALGAAVEDADPSVAAAAIVGILRDPRGGSGVTDQASDRAERRLAALVAGEGGKTRPLGLDVMRRIGRQLDMGQREGALADPSPSVRSIAVAMLADAPDPAATGDLLHALHDPDPAVRGAAAEALASRSTVEPEVLALLRSGTPEQQDSAVAALAGHGEAVRDPLLAWAERAVARARLLADARSGVAVDRHGWQDGQPELEAFLLTTLDRRVEREHDRVLTAIALLGAPAAGGVIRRTLRSADADARAQSLEALESIGDPRLAVALTRLLEPAPEVASPDAASSDSGAGLDRLCDDGDPWIRGLARLIRASGDDMADPDRSLGDIERMLRLRRIPLFEPLAPEDLQRIARAAEERHYAPGEALVREGETGDELFLILDGRVVVTRREPDGTDRRIRTYQAGDHIGELAVLRARPRVATVAADGGPVSTLVIAGEGLTAILRERPDAAMAMLGTLAERISLQ